MKILYYFAQYDSPMYHWQDNHIIDELLHYNIEMEIFNPLAFESIEEANENVIKKIKNGDYSLFFTCNNEFFCHKDTIAEIKSLGIPTLLWCPDSLMTPFDHKSIIPFFDAVMISQEDKHGFYKKLNSNIIVSHYAANPFFFTPNFKCEKMPRIAFPGTPYGSRAKIISDLSNNGCPIDLYYGGDNANKVKPKYIPPTPNAFNTAIKMLTYEEGRKVILSALKEKVFTNKSKEKTFGDVQYFKSVSLRETNQIYSQHDLSLSIAIGRNTGNLKEPINIVHLRNFEIPMSGGVQICEYFEELASCFDENKEIIFYHSMDEMIDKAKFYLKPENEGARNLIRINARRRAESEHTWFNRFSRAFDILGIQY